MNRIKRERNTNYTTISNVFLRDKDLSLKSKGFLAVIMGLPEDWEFSINGICAILKEGRTAVYSTIAELKERGYCRITECHDASGKFAGCDYTFTEEPEAETPHTENPHTENKTQIKKEDNQINNREKKEVKDTLTLPFSSPKFEELWQELRTMPKWKKKTANALQMNLNKLGRFDEQFAIELMENAIAGDYQGVVFQDTERRYEEWKAKKNGRFQTGYRQERPKEKSAFRAMMDMLNDINGVKEDEADEQ